MGGRKYIYLYIYLFIFKAMKKFLMPYCRVCRIGFKSPMLYENHICSLDHLKVSAYCAYFIILLKGRGLFSLCDNVCSQILIN